jgi:histidinol-phosphatase (PHP family)
LAEHVASAKERKVFSLGFSSHAPLPFECKWCMQKEKLPHYLEEIESLKKSNQGIELYKSLEVDFIPGIISPNDFDQFLDYTIGSIHFVDELPDKRRWEIDNTHQVFQEGLQQIFKGNLKDAIVRYFELTREMIYNSVPTIIGHLDKIKIQNIDGKFFSETDDWYQQEIKKLLKLIDQADIIIEVNTRGLYQKKSPTTYPSPWILELIHKMNLPITMSSDSHLKEDVINQFPETAKLLYNIGFRNLTIMQAGRWKQLPFNEHGIIQ